MKKQLDEMDRVIKLRAESLGFKVAVLFIAMWTLYESFAALTTGQRLNIAPCLMLTFLYSVEGIYEMVLKGRMIKGDEEYREPNKVLWFILAVIAITAITTSVGSLMILR